MAGDKQPSKDSAVLDRHVMRALRRLYEIPQTDLADAIGRSQFYISAIERGAATPTPREIQIITKILNPRRNRRGGGQ